MIKLIKLNKPRKLNKLRKFTAIFIFLLLIMLVMLALTACSSNDETDIRSAETEPGTTTGAQAVEDVPTPQTGNGGRNVNANENGNGTENGNGNAENCGSHDNGGYENCEDYYINGEPPPQRFFCFLTGLETTRQQQLRRPVSIIINNDRLAQPTVGVGAADIIYETLIEGGVTRLMLVLADYENVPVFGSVRSARDYMVDLSQTHDAIFVHAGGTTMAYTELNTRGIDRIDGVNAVGNMRFDETFYRDAQRRRTMVLEHTLMTTGAGIAAGIQRAGYRTTLAYDFTGSFRFHRQFQPLPANNNIAHYVAVPFAANTVREFIYNPENGLYYRRQFGTAHIDGATGEQLRFENIIVMFAEYTNLRMAGNYLACRLTGTGFGFYISGGRHITIRWRKDTRDGPLYFFHLDGSELYLNPGRTFICVTSTAFNHSVVINADLKDIG